MASRSSRQKNAGSKVGRRALFARLLRQGERFQNPGVDILEAAAELQASGLIQLRQAQAVFCANPDDRDFPPRDPDCPGLIELREGADEGGGDYACPTCDRLVHPTRSAKERVQVLTARLDQQGIERFVLQQCGQATADLVFERGVLVLPGRPQNRFICIVDFCTHPVFLDRGWIATQPCIYITVDPRVRVHLGTTHQARVVELVDLVCGGVVLDELLDQSSRADAHATRAGPCMRTNPAAPSRPSLDERLRNQRSHRFAVALIDQGVVVEGMVIGCDTNGVPYLSFTELMHQAASDVASGREITPLTAKEIADRINGKLPAATVNPGNVQKGLKRLDRSIVELLQRAGFFINEGDVIENVARAGKYRGRPGFRLNPDKVSLSASSTSNVESSEATSMMSGSARHLKKSAH
jgi:hypothetical protein